MIRHETQRVHMGVALIHKHCLGSAMGIYGEFAFRHCKQSVYRIPMDSPLNPNTQLQHSSQREQRRSLVLTLPAPSGGCFRTDVCCL